MESLESRKNRMLAARVFHFDSGADNRQNLLAALELEAEGKLTITENRYEQHTVYQCEVQP